MSELKSGLLRYFPNQSIESVIQIIENENVQLIVSKKRKTKLGDYRPPQRSIGFHRISVNYNLQPDLFLLIFLHEYAHLLTWKVFKNKVLPHGEEWKHTYINLIISFINGKCFKDEIVDILEKNIQNPVNAENIIVRHLHKSEKVEDGFFYIEQLKPQTIFIAENGMQYQIIEKLSKRFKCLCLNNNRLYVFHPFAKVKINQ